MIVYEPAWFTYLMGKFSALTEGVKEEELTFGHLQDALNTINEKETEMRFMLARLCNRKAFMEYAEKESSLTLGERRYEGQFSALEFFEDYAVRHLPVFDEFSFYENHIQLHIGCFFAKVPVPAWAWAANQALPPKEPERYCYGDILDALESIFGEGNKA